MCWMGKLFYEITFFLSYFSPTCIILVLVICSYLLIKVHRPLLDICFHSWISVMLTDGLLQAFGSGCWPLFLFHLIPRHFMLFNCILLPARCWISTCWPMIWSLSVVDNYFSHPIPVGFWSHLFLKMSGLSILFWSREGTNASGFFQLLYMHLL